MRWVLLVFIFAGVYADAKSQDLFASLNTRGVQSPVFKPSFSYKTFDKALLPPGYRMRKVGSTLTIAGAALFLGGIIVVSEADKTSYYNSSTGQQVYDDPMFGAGSLMLVAGVGMMVPGIIFWSKGAKRYNQYLRDLQASVVVNGSGLSVRLKL